MEIKINIEKRHLYIFSSIIGILIGILIVNAYNPSVVGGSPPIFGHSIDEIDWTQPVPNNISIISRTASGGALINLKNNNNVWIIKALSNNARLSIRELSDSNTNEVISISSAGLNVNRKLTMPSSNFYTAQGSCTIPPGPSSTCTAIASCNSGDIATGGGALGPALISGSGPSGTGENWFCTITGSQGNSITCIARCFDTS